MRSNIKHGAILKCDAAAVDERRCDVTFTSFSHVPLIREQAKVDGWDRVPAWQIPGGLNGSRNHDVCPVHARVALANQDRQKELAAEKRAKDKAERDQLRAEEAADREAARAKKQADKIANDAAIAKRKADHAARKALLLEQKLARRAKRKKGAA